MLCVNGGGAGNDPTDSLMAYKKKEQKEKIIERLIENGGNVSEVARHFKMERRTITRWMEEDDEFAEMARYEVKEIKIDRVEETAFNLMMGIKRFKPGTNIQTGWKVKPSVTLIEQFLETVAAARGYQKNIVVNTRNVEKYANMTEDELIKEIKKTEANINGTLKIA